MTRDETSRRRTWRRWLAGCGVVALLLVVGVVGTWWAARSYGPSLTRERLELALEGALGAPVRIDAVQIEPWRGRVVVTGVRLAAGTTWEAGTLLSVRRAEVRIGISSLWRREIALSRVVIEDAVLAYTESTSSAPFRFPDRFPDRLEMGPVSAGLGPVDLVRARITYRAAAPGPVVEADGVDATLSVDRGALAATITAVRAAVRATGLDEELDRVALAARLDGARLSVEHIRARWLSAEIRGAARVSDLDRAPVIDARLEGTLPLRPILSRAGLAWPLDGSGRIEATLTGALASPAVSATVAVPTLTVGPVEARHVSGRLDWKGGVLTVDAMEADALGGHVSGGLTVTTGDSVRVGLRARGAGLAVEALAPPLAELSGLALRLPPGVTGPITLDGEYEGLVSDLAAGRGSITVEAPSVSPPTELAGLGPLAVSGEAHLTGRTIELRRGRLRTRVAEIEAKGAVGLDGGLALSAEISADAADAAGALGTTPVDGRLNASVRASGPLARPIMTGEARAARLTAHGVTIERVTVPFRVEGLSVEVARAGALLGQGRVALGGDARWRGPLDRSRWRQALEFRASLDVESLAAEDVTRWLAAGWAAEGRLHGRLRAEGTPEAWRAIGRATAPRLSVNGQPVEDVAAGLTVSPAGIELTSASLRAGGVPIAGSGRWQWDGAGSARVDLGPARLDGLHLVPARVGLSGTVRGRAEIEASAGEVTLSSTLSGDGLAAGGVRLGAGRLTARLKDRNLDADVSLPECGVTVSATGRLAPGGAIAARLRAHDVDVAALAGHRLPPWVSGIAGRLSAAGEITVPVDRPGAAEGTLRVEPPGVTIAGEEWRARGPVLLRRRAGATMIERFEVESRLGTVTAVATLSDDGTLAGTLDGRMPLGIVPALRPEVREAGGVVALAGRLAGTLADPRIVADGVIGDGRLVLRDYPDAMRDIRARFSVSPSGLTLTEASASVGGGEVTARGDLALLNGAVGSYRFAVTARRVALATVADLQTVWDADLELAAVGSRSLLRGEARLVRGLYARDISLLKTLLERRAPQAGPTPGGIVLDVRCALQDSLVVRTNVARFRARGTLSIQGTTGAPAVFGTVEGHGGDILFRKQAFRIVSALARFDDPRRIDPILDVRGIARIRDHEVRLSVRGRAEDLEIRFASSPALPEEDVLALVAFGKTRAELARGGGGAALGEAAGFLLADLLGIDSGRLGLDVLEFETTPEGRRRTGTRESEGRELRVGKRIGPGTTVVYTQGIEEWGRQTLRIEYEVVGPLVVAGEQDFRGGFGGDILLRLRFR